MYSYICIFSIISSDQMSFGFMRIKTNRGRNRPWNRSKIPLSDRLMRYYTLDFLPIGIGKFYKKSILVSHYIKIISTKKLLVYCILCIIYIYIFIKWRELPVYCTTIVVCLPVYKCIYI